MIDCQHWGYKISGIYFNVFYLIFLMISIWCFFRWLGVLRDNTWYSRCTFALLRTTFSYGRQYAICNFIIWILILRFENNIVSSSACIAKFNRPTSIAWENVLAVIEDRIVVPCMKPYTFWRQLLPKESFNLLFYIFFFRFNISCISIVCHLL